MEKIAASFHYFLNEYVYIEDKDRKMPVLFKLWPEQERILPKIIDTDLLIILKARQLGLTWLCAAYALWYTMTRPMKLVVVISAKGDWAVEFLERVYFMLGFLPPEIYTIIEKDTTEVLRFSHEGSLTSTIKSLTTTEAGAQSKTPDVLILDETCWNPYVRSIYSASKPGIDAAGGRIIAISNSIKDAPGWGWTRDIYTGSMKDENDWERIFMSWDAHPRRPENFKEIQLRGGLDAIDFSNQYPETEEEAISAMLGSYFGGTLAKHDKFIRDNEVGGLAGYLERDKAKDIQFQNEERGVVELWRWPYHLLKSWNKVYWSKRYCIGSDVSEGLGQSYSVAYVMDRKLDEFVCRVRSNRLDAVEWAAVLYELSLWFSNGTDAYGKSEPALICVERTGAGITTVKELAKTKNPGARQYVKIHPGKVGSGLTRVLGWDENEASKHILCGDLKAWFRKTGESGVGGFYCPILIDEASTTIKHEGSRKIGPEDDTKLWDTVVAAGCTIQASIFMEGPPKQLIPDITGWRARQAKEGKSAWGR